MLSTLNARRLRMCHEREHEQWLEAYEKLPTLISAYGKDSAYYDEERFKTWKILMTRHRDNEDEPLVASNWDTALSMLGDENPDEGVYIQRAGHFGVGWVEYLVVDKNKAAIAGQIVCSLAEYPILDEEDFSAKELAVEEAEEAAYREDHCYIDKTGLTLSVPEDKDKAKEDIKEYVKKRLNEDPSVEEYLKSSFFANMLYDELSWPDLLDEDTIQEACEQAVKEQKLAWETESGQQMLDL
jgi:hypothetical protein